MNDEELLALLACPACRGALRGGDDHLGCTACGRRYPIRDGIPHLLTDEAQVTTPTPDASAAPRSTSLASASSSSVAQDGAGAPKAGG